MKNKKEIACIEKVYKTRSSDLKQEKDKTMADMVKMQSEKDLKIEKDKVVEKKNKIEKNPKLFNVLVENGHELTELSIPEEENKHDECIS